MSVTKLRDNIRRIAPNEIIKVRPTAIEQLTIFEEQQLAELKENTTTIRIRTDLISRYKELALKNHIRFHGKLINAVLEEVLIKLEASE